MKLKYATIGFFFFLSIKMQAQLHVEGLLFIDEGAEVHVWNDLEIATENGQVSNGGLLEIEGDLSKETMASFDGNPNNFGTRTVVLRNDDFNTTNDQRIAAEMTEDNAFFNLVIDNTGANKLVDMNQDIEIKNNLVFTSGRLRTDTIAQGTDGNAYANEVLVSNFFVDAIQGNTLIAGTDRYVEGRLSRAISGMSNTYTFPVGLAPDVVDGAEPFELTFTNPAPMSILTATYQVNTTTPIGNTQFCDVGTAGDPFTPDGNVDELTTDCALGQWTVMASENFAYQYDLTLFPGANLLSNCPDALYFYMGQDGNIEDCPDIDSNDGIRRTDLEGFATFDVTTASENSTVIVSIEVIPTDDKRIILFPNPVTNNLINLSIAGDVFQQGVATIEVYNTLGQLVFQQ